MTSPNPSPYSPPPTGSQRPVVDQAAVANALSQNNGEVDLPPWVAGAAARAWNRAVGEPTAAVVDAVYASSHDTGQRHGVQAAVEHILHRLETARAGLGDTDDRTEVRTVLSAVEAAAKVRGADPLSPLYGSGANRPSPRAYDLAHSAAMSAAKSGTPEAAVAAAARAAWRQGFREGQRESYWHVNGVINSASEMVDDRHFTTVVEGHAATVWLEKLRDEGHTFADPDRRPLAEKNPRAVHESTPSRKPATAARQSFPTPPTTGQPQTPAKTPSKPARRGRGRYHR